MAECCSRLWKYWNLQEQNLCLVGMLLNQFRQGLQSQNIDQIRTAQKGLCWVLAKPMLKALIDTTVCINGLHLTGTPTLTAGLQTANVVPQVFTATGTLNIDGRLTPFDWPNLSTARELGNNFQTLNNTLESSLVVVSGTRLQITLATAATTYTVGVIDPVLGTHVVNYPNTTPAALLANIQRDFDLQPTLMGSVLTLTDIAGNNIVFGGASQVTMLTSQGVSLHTFSYTTPSPQTIYVGVVELYSTANGFSLSNLSANVSLSTVVASIIQTPFLLPYYLAQYETITTVECYHSTIRLQAVVLPLVLLADTRQYSPSLLGTIISLLGLVRQYLGHIRGLCTLLQTFEKSRQCDQHWNNG